MKILKILKYEDLGYISKCDGKEFIVDLEECDIKLRRRVMDFLTGRTQQKGKIEKISSNKFIVKIEGKPFDEENFNNIAQNLLNTSEDDRFERFFEKLYNISKEHLRKFIENNKNNITEQQLKWVYKYYALRENKHMKINNLNLNYIFDNFNVDSSNRFAYIAAKDIASNPGEDSKNPFFIYGDTGSGKTHLMNAIGNQIIKEFPEQKVLYITGNEFIDDVMENVQNNKITYLDMNDIDVLLLDDIQVLSGKEEAQKKLVKIFNRMFEKEKQIILTSNMRPKDIPDFNLRLVSKIEGGLVASIKNK